MRRTRFARLATARSLNTKGAPRLDFETWDPAGGEKSHVSARHGAPTFKNRRKGVALRLDAGVTLVELVVVISIIAILAAAAVPVTRWQVKRTKERELRTALWEIRGAIDKYKDAYDRGVGIQTKIDSFGYPPDLETLVNGVDVQTKKVKFLRRIPKDPMTGNTEWQLRAMQDDADSTSWGGQNVFDIHSKSQGKALDGTKYSEW